MLWIFKYFYDVSISCPCNIPALCLGCLCRRASIPAGTVRSKCKDVSGPSLECSYVSDKPCWCLSSWKYSAQFTLSSWHEPAAPEGRRLPASWSQSRGSWNVPAVVFSLPVLTQNLHWKVMLLLFPLLSSLSDKVISEANDQLSFNSATMENDY